MPDIAYIIGNQNKTNENFYSESVSSGDLGYTETESEQEDLEESEDEENQNKNEENRIEEENDKNPPIISSTMETEELRELQEQMASLQTQLRLQHRAQQQTVSQHAHWNKHLFQKQSVREDQLLSMVMTLKMWIDGLIK